MSCRADVKNVFHNAETGQFEADVTLFDREAAETFSVEVLAPISVAFDALRPALIRAAQAQQSNQATLRRKVLSKPMPNRTEEMLDRILFAQPSYLDTILARVA